MRLLVPSRRLFITCFFFFNDPATTEIYTLSLHDALPISAPKRNQPMYAPPSPLWSLMVISLFLSEALNEHPQALLEPHCHADQLPGARQAAQHPHEPREPIGHALDLVGHRADALELAARLADEPADVLGQRVGLAHEGPERSEEHTSELQSQS